MLRSDTVHGSCTMLIDIYTSQDAQGPLVTDHKIQQQMTIKTLPANQPGVTLSATGETDESIGAYAGNESTRSKPSSGGNWIDMMDPMATGPADVAFKIYVRSAGTVYNVGSLSLAAGPRNTMHFGMHRAKGLFTTDTVDVTEIFPHEIVIEDVPAKRKND